MGFATFIWSLVLHAFSASGSLGHHVRAMSGGNISDASAHERRQGLGWDWFEAFFEALLRLWPGAQRMTEVSITACACWEWTVRVESTQQCSHLQLPRRRHASAVGCDLRLVAKLR